jgi:hypothetical protein
MRVSLNVSFEGDDSYRLSPQDDDDDADHDQDEDLDDLKVDQEEQNGMKKLKIKIKKLQSLLKNEQSRLISFNTF